MFNVLVLRCKDIMKSQDSSVKIAHELYLGFPATCTQIDSQSIALTTSENKTLIPLHFKQIGIFKNLKGSSSSLYGSKNNVMRICSALGYNHFTSKVITLEKHKNAMVEINDDLQDYKSINQYYDSLTSITCSRRGIFSFLMNYTL